MGKKRHKADETVAKLRQIEVLTTQGRPVVVAVSRIGVTEVKNYRWRSEYGGSYDFLEDWTHDWIICRMLNFIDEFTGECLAIQTKRRLISSDVIDVFSGLFILRGIPTHVRSDNGPEFIAKPLRDWLEAVGAWAAYILPCSPRGEALENSLQWSALRSSGYREKFH